MRFSGLTILSRTSGSTPLVSIRNKIQILNYLVEVMDKDLVLHVVAIY